MILKEVESKLVVFNITGKEVGFLDLPESFGKSVNSALIHQAVVMYQANKRQGTVDTKTRAEISGGGRKPFRQKGTGRARQGSSRSPLMHHGGIVFGPHPRDFSYTVPKKIRVSALRDSLNVKFMDSSLICVDGIEINSLKTRVFVDILKNLKIFGQKLLVLTDGCSNDLMLVSRNISFVQLSRAVDVNALDILQNNKILATKVAMETILKRLQ